MAEKTQKEQKLKDEAEMKRLHKLMLQLEMVEMVHDLDLLPAAAPKSGPVEKAKERKK